MLATRGRDDVVVRSGGIAAYARDSSLVSLDARLVLREDGIEVSAEATACDLKRHPELLAEADLIITMTDEQRHMLADFPAAAGRPTFTLRELAGEHGDIDDPAGRGEEVFRACRDRIHSCLERALERIASAGLDGP